MTPREILIETAKLRAGVASVEELRQMVDGLLRLLDEAPEKEPVRPMATIYAVEINWPPIQVPVEEIEDRCRHIWKHPDQYSDYKPHSEGAYYQFLKFLWVRYPDGREERLPSIATRRE